MGVFSRLSIAPAVILFVAVACSSAADATDDGSSSSGGASSGSSSSGSTSGGNSQQATDGQKNGSETDVDCGGPDRPKCAEGKSCGGNDDCETGVCKAGSCAAPSADDGVKNGTETDVDCGGQSGKMCAAGLTCAAHADCESDGCGPDKKCAIARSCATEAGGTTCGEGAVDAAGKKHESCCKAAELPTNPKVYMDKYLITAGRMRQFVERLNGDLRSFTSKLPEGGFIGWQRAFDQRIPQTLDATLFEFGSHADTAGCDLNNGSRARTYWMTQAQNTALGESQTHPAGSQPALDAKVMNCAAWYMFAALCAWDGARLPTPAELQLAWRAGEGRQFPWGNQPNDATRSPWSYAHEYPANLVSNTSHWHDVPEPGRYPAGYGKFGHADLAGAMFQYTNQVNGGQVVNFTSGSWQSHPIQGGTSNVNIARTYWAFGARCVREKPN